MSDEHTAPISEVRHCFERVKADYQEPGFVVFYRKVDECLTALEKQYGAEVPMSALVQGYLGFEECGFRLGDKDGRAPYSALWAARILLNGATSPTA